MEVASEGTNLMKKVHPDEHIVPSLEIDLELDAQSLTLWLLSSHRLQITSVSLREDGAVLLNALKHYDDVRLSNLGMELHNKLDGEANQTTAVCKLIQEGYMKILAAAV
ncbi:hypothetical protein F2Q70_00038134 [Brassica cretica]|uniref:Uncharacterized protein n=1 Tax=Brassica cretica TaxID=69181 RepID=A0A8S9K9C9_BRACR|nr:hypothetical protein F2Q70_00038134 [Brassica cretica]